MSTLNASFLDETELIYFVGKVLILFRWLGALS
jgi:hypothetical protein